MAKSAWYELFYLMKSAGSDFFPAVKLSKAKIDFLNFFCGNLTFSILTKYGEGSGSDFPVLKDFLE